MLVKYEAINKSGEIISDTLAVENIAQAHGKLHQSGLIPVRITESTAPRRFSLRESLLFMRRLGRSEQANPRRASKRELPFFTEQMSILLETGTPVAPSLHAIERQVACPHWRMLVSGLKRQVEEGNSLAAAVASYPEIFDPIYSSMISAGEASGNLPNILTRLAELARQSDRIRRKVVSALIYPTLLTSIALTVVTVLIFFVLPRFAAIFEEMKVELPGTTKTLLVISSFVRQNIFLVLPALAAVITASVWWLRSIRGKRFIAHNILRLPIFGRLIRSIINARIFRLIGLLIESSVGMLESLDLTLSATKNYIYKDLLTRMRDNVINGQPMYEAMLNNYVIPVSVAQMVHTGEENAQVGRVMTMLADHLDDRNNTQIGTLTSIMEPVILIFMGLIIGLVAISLVLPMFDLSRISG
jgi:type IV pilus assembly protein PilC